jgi:hypothetical protein
MRCLAVSAVAMYLGNPRTADRNIMLLRPNSHQFLRRYSSLF